MHFRRFTLLLLLVLLTLYSGCSGDGSGANPWSGGWTQDATGGMDGTYRYRSKMAPSMAMNGSDLFVGTGIQYPPGKGASVWRYDGSTWTLAGENGMGDPGNEIVWAMETFDTRLYAGTLNPGGCQVLRYEGGTSWTQVNESGFGEASQDAVMAMGLHGGALYAGTSNTSTGAEVWRFDGTSWTCAGRPGPDTWESANWAATSMAQYEGRLYVGFYNRNSGAEVWSYDGSRWQKEIDGGFGSGSATREVMSMAVLADQLFVGTYDAVNGCEIWGYDEDTGWNPVSAIGRGFGNPENFGAQSLVAKGDSLIVGTYNNGTGCEVWRWDFFDIEQLAEGSFDEQLDTSGPGKKQDVGIASLFLYGTDLYCGTQSMYVCEVRRYAGGKEWPLVAPLGFAANQSMTASAMAVYDGRVVAGTSGLFNGCRVWRRGDLGGWAPISSLGFGSSAYNYAVESLCQYGPNLYAGVSSDYGCGVWRYNGSVWTQVNQPGFGEGTPEILDMTEFDGYLFVTTLQGGIWRYDGGNWITVTVGELVDYTARALAVYDGLLYAGLRDEVYRYDGGTSWTRVSEKGFGDAENRFIDSLCVMDGKLYAGTDNDNGCQVWSYDGEGWQRMGDSGFGEKENKIAASMVTFDSRLYVGTKNEDGGQVWSYDGVYWSRAAPPGFGDADNLTVKSLLAHGSDLYAGTFNEWSGCGVWRTFVKSAGSALESGQN